MQSLHNLCIDMSTYLTMSLLGCVWVHIQSIHIVYLCRHVHLFYYELRLD